MQRGDKHSEDDLFGSEKSCEKCVWQGILPCTILRDKLHKKSPNVTEALIQIVCRSLTAKLVTSGQGFRKTLEGKQQMSSAFLNLTGLNTSNMKLHEYL